MRSRGFTSFASNGDLGNENSWNRLDGDRQPTVDGGGIYAPSALAGSQPGLFLMAPTSTKRTILVTGSNGLIGSEVCLYFASRGFDVSGLDNNQRAVFFGPQGDTRWNQSRLQEAIRNFRHYEVDVRDRAGIDRTIKDVSPQLIVHAAAQQFPAPQSAANLGIQVGVRLKTKAQTPLKTFRCAPLPNERSFPAEEDYGP